MFKRFIPILLLGISFFHLSDVYACSGGMPSTLPELVADSEIIVQGHMVMVDERGQNGVLQVEHVLSSATVPQFILLDLAPSGFIYREQERFSSGACFHGVNPLSLNETIIFLLQKLPNEAYKLAPLIHMNGEYFAFPTSDSTVSVFTAPPTGNTSNQWQVQHLDLKTLTQRITEIIGQAPHLPDMNAPYPLPTSLYIRTEAGTEYSLPVNLSSPIPISSKLADESGSINSTGCSTVYCIAYSPNGIDSAQVTPDYTVKMLSFAGSDVPGSAFRFSTTSDALAVWNTNTLSVYALPYDRLGFCCYNLTLINSIALTNIIKNETGVAWSPDGRLLAYSDSTGLYLWDVFTSGSRPRLLAAPLYNPITPLFFSETSRYLAISRRAKRSYMDMVSGLELPDGIISPDDREQLQFNTQHPSALQLYHLAPYRQKDLLTDYRNVRQAEWIDQSFYLVAGCTDQQPNECHVWQGGLLSGGSAQYDGFAFAYDKVTRTIALAMLGKRIAIVDSTRANKIYDFGAVLDSEIQSIQWMQPIFFQPNP